MKQINFYKPLILLLTILIIGCSTDDEKDFIEPVTVENIMNVSIDGKAYTAINESVGGNENCDKLYVYAYYYDENNIKLRLNISLSKTGQFLRVMYIETLDPNTSESQIAKIFVAPNYNPTQTFSISDFSYNPENGNLEFDFSGTIYQELDNENEREIAGSIDIKSIKTTNCSVAITGMSYFSENFYLYSYSDVSTKYPDDTQRHRFFSNNGYIVDIHVAQDLWNLPLESIAFDENSLQNKVSIQKQLGEIVANQTHLISDHDWLNYDTRGEIIIEDKIMENGHKKIIGKINLDVIENGNILHSLQEIEFRTRSFEN